MAIFSGTMMDDILMGTMDDDVLWGGMGDDDLSGGAGNDRLEGGPGADDLDGGPGTMDVASYRNSDAGVKVDLSDSFVEDDDDPGPVFGGHADGDTLRGIEGLWGSDFSDKLLGNHTANYIFGFNGNDIIMGRRGGDLLRGQGGDDQLMGDGGDDTLYGDMGGDLLQGGSGNDLLRGGEGVDVLEGGMGDDVLEGGPDGDELSGGYESLNDDGTLKNGGSDTAAYTMSPEAVTVDLRYPADPTKQAPMGGDALGDMLDGIENLRGSMYDDVLIGDGGKNKLFGNMGNDMLKGMGNADTLHGGKGMDTLYGGEGNDTLKGEMGDDALKGEGGSDTLVGGPGADKLFGGEFDAETMKAGADDVEAGGMTVEVVDDRKVLMVTGDTADYTMSDAGVHISLTPDDHDEDRSTPNNIVGTGGHAEGDILVAIENLTGSAHTDMLEGNAVANILKGGDGDDWDNAATPAVTEGGLFGGKGNDTLDGGDGMDLLEGGDGIDDLWGGAGDDLIKGGAGSDFTYRPFDATRATPDDASTAGYVDENEDTSANDGDIILILGDDLKTYADLKDVPDGYTRGGLYGGPGDDTLMGGAGSDYMDGGSGSDTADYSGRSSTSVAVDLRLEGAQGTTPAQSVVMGTTTIDLGAAPTPRDPSAATGDVLRNIENVTGSSENDTIVGNNGANVITGGGTGITSNTAATGGDELWGAGGADTFVFTPDSDGNFQDRGTVIRDFSSREGDKIDLSAFNLSQQELINMLDQINAGVLDLANTGVSDLAGQFTVTVQGRDLDVDDFML